LKQFNARFNKKKLIRYGPKDSGIIDTGVKVIDVKKEIKDTVVVKPKEELKIDLKGEGSENFKKIKNEYEMKEKLLLLSEND